MKAAWKSILGCTLYACHARNMHGFKQLPETIHKRISLSAKPVREERKSTPNLAPSSAANSARKKSPMADF